MTELDFAELDKAVNDLMKDTTAPKQPGTASDDTAPRDTTTKTLATPTTPALSQEPESQRTDSVAEDTPSQETAKPDKPASTEAVPSSLATKRRGRFMDVVHPSTDMKTMRAPKREGVKLQPLTKGTSETDEALEEKREPAEHANTSEMIATPSVETESTGTPETESETTVAESPKNEYPDPITFNQKEITSPDMPAEATPSLDEVSTDKETAPETALETPEAPEDEKTAESTPSDDAADEEAFKEKLEEVTTSKADDRPLISPFLPDTKVEKRPLGGAPLETAPSEPLPETPAADDTALVAAQKETTTPLPAELSGAVMAVESSPVSHAPTPEAEETSKAAPEAKPEPVHELPADKPTQTSFSGSGSIPQQYTKQPSSSEQASGSIYDTKTYHQPLDHPAKKKSGVGVIVWILVLMIIGALAGAAYFYFTTR